MENFSLKIHIVSFVAAAFFFLISCSTDSESNNDTDSFLLSDRFLLTDQEDDLAMQDGLNLKSLQVNYNIPEDQISFEIQIYEKNIRDNFEMVLWFNSDEDRNNGLNLFNPFPQAKVSSPNTSMNFDGLAIHLLLMDEIFEIYQWTSTGGSGSTRPINFIVNDSTLQFDVPISDLDQIDHDNRIDFILGASDLIHGPNGNPEGTIYDFIPDNDFITIPTEE